MVTQGDMAAALQKLKRELTKAFEEKNKLLEQELTKTNQKLV